MSDATDNKAWPGTKFFGEPERYAQYATDQEGWAITNDDDEFLESRDPSTIPRVEAPYTAALVQPIRSHKSVRKKRGRRPEFVRMYADVAKTQDA